MANAKIISFVDHEVSRVIAETAEEIETQRVDLVRHIAILTDRIRQTRLDLTHAIADNTLTLRHDINTLAAAINTLRQDIESLKQGGGSPKTSA